MGHRSRFVAGSLLGAALIHVVLVACSARGPSTAGPSGEDAAGFADAVAAGDLGRTVDAAARLADAAVDALADLGRAETPDARAGGPPMDLACDVTAVQRIASTGSTTVLTSYYASISTTLSPRGVPDVRAVVCDPVEDTNPCRPYASSTGITCELTGFATGTTTCSQAAVIFDGGRVLVPCGTVVQTGTTTSGFHYRHAFVSLP